MAKSVAGWSIASARCKTSASGAGNADRLASFLVHGSIFAGRSGAVGDHGSAAQRTPLPLAPQNAAEDATDPEEQDRAQADGSHHKPPDQAHATAHPVGSPRTKPGIEQGHVAEETVGRR